MYSLASDWVAIRQRLATVRVVIRLRAYQPNREDDLHIKVRVDVPTASTKTTILMSDVTLTCDAFALARGRVRSSNAAAYLC